MPTTAPAPTRDDWEFMVPYGKWTTADGREVLHNRAYRPILEKYPGQPARAARPGEWVKDIVTAENFWDDYDSPLHDKPGTKALRRVNAVLAKWGMPKLPRRPSAPAEPQQFWYAKDVVLKAFHNPWQDILGGAT
jgi:hypothetical protein